MHLISSRSQRNSHAGDVMMSTNQEVDEATKFLWSQSVPSYSEKLLGRLTEFRKNGVFYDVTLLLQDGKLFAHKIVLIACGGVFR